jgi:hypothetical protein
VVACRAKDTRTKLSKKEKEWRENMEDIPEGRFVREKIASIERVFGLVLGFDAKMFDERCDTTAADINHNTEGEIGSNICLSRNSWN